VRRKICGEGKERQEICGFLITEKEGKYTKERRVVSLAISLAFDRGE